MVVQDALQDWRALQPAAAVNVAAWAVGLHAWGSFETAYLTACLQQVWLL